MDIFLRGYNVFEEIRDNILMFTMDKPEDGGLDLEVAGYYGDSGSGGFVVIDDELYIVGVLSFGQGPYWGGMGGYPRVGGYHKEWIDANLESPDERIAPPGRGCSNGTDNDDDDSGDGDDGDDSGDGEDNDDSEDGSDDEDDSGDGEDNNDGEDGSDDEDDETVPEEVIELLDEAAGAVVAASKLVEGASDTLNSLATNKVNGEP